MGLYPREKDAVNLRQRLAALQRQMASVQGSPVPEGLQRQLQVLQRQLHEMEALPVATGSPLPGVFNPVPPDVPLEGFELEVWQTFLNYHRALLIQAGRVNKDQWLALADHAADLTGAFYGVPPLPPPPPIEEAPDTVEQPYSRDGRAQDWVLAIPDAPDNSAIQPYARNGFNKTWMRAVSPPEGVPNGLYAWNTTGGGYWESTVNRPLSGVGPWGFNATSGLWETVQPLNGVTNGSNAAPGIVGQVIDSQSTGTTTYPIGNTSTTTPFNTCISITLTPGDWELSASIRWATNLSAAAPGPAYCQAVLSTTPDGGPPSSGIINPDVWLISNPLNENIVGASATFVPRRINISANQTWYLNMSCFYPPTAPANTLYAGFGFMHARRMR